jgi:hypothetical protein
MMILCVWEIDTHRLDCDMESSPDDEKLSCVRDIGVPKSIGMGRRTCMLLC